MRQFVEVAWDCLCKHGEELCGDSVKMTTTPSSIIMVLSDGLGSGVKANIMSTLTAQIAATMFVGGAHVKEVMETLVQTLPECQVRKLAYATFSMLKVSRGRDAYLVLYDSPALILIRNGQVVHVPTIQTTHDGRLIHEARFKVFDGDYMVLLSDGYEHAGVGGLFRLGWGWPNVAEAARRFVETRGDAYALTHALSRTCMKLYSEKPGDDASVIGMRVRPEVDATVWTGPPGDRSKDEQAVRMLTEAVGLKVICGGTTAQIAARVLGKELKVEWVPPSRRQGSPGRGKGTPPTARLEGIDLVTEGILTLAQAVERMEHCETIHDLPPGDDAATRLARILLSADSVRLIVGTALNPNQVADIIRGEPMRMVYVRELIRELKRRAKEVTVERI